MKRDSLSPLIARSFGLADVIQPVLPSRFEPIGRVPLPGMADFGLEEAAEPAEAAPGGIRPAVKAIQAAVPAEQVRVETIQAAGAETLEDLAAARRHAVRPAYVSPRPTEAQRGSVLSPIARAQRQDEAPAEKARYPHRSSVPAPANDTVGFSRQELARPAESREPARRRPERERVNRDISPTEIRIREPEPDKPKTEPRRDEPGRGSFGQQGSQEQKVTVHIGRIEVRAVLAPASEPERKHPVDNRQRLTLSDYLKQREQREKGAK